MKTDAVTLVATGTAWTGKGVRSVDSLISDMLDAASFQVTVLTYVVGRGGTEFLGRLEVCLRRGVKVSMIVNRFDEQLGGIRNHIRSMIANYHHFSAFSFNPRNRSEELHAKVIVVDSSSALVGSANLSWGGLVGNHELGLVIEGPTVEKILRLVHRLTRDSRTVPLAE